MKNNLELQYVPKKIVFPRRTLDEQSKQLIINGLKATRDTLSSQGTNFSVFN